LTQEDTPQSLEIPKISTKNESWRYSLNYEQENLLDNGIQNTYQKSNFEQKQTNEDGEEAKEEEEIVRRIDTFSQIDGEKGTLMSPT
jgi:hypothetical protein